MRLAAVLRARPRVTSLRAGLPRPGWCPRAAVARLRQARCPALGRWSSWRAGIQAVAPAPMPRGANTRRPAFRWAKTAPRARPRPPAGCRPETPAPGEPGTAARSVFTEVTRLRNHHL